jgi:hypothetical protein
MKRVILIALILSHTAMGEVNIPRHVAVSAVTTAGLYFMLTRVLGMDKGVRSNLLAVIGTEIASIGYEFTENRNLTGTHLREAMIINSVSSIAVTVPIYFLDR